eukprot:60491-Rhodomonas_salina.3
MQALRAATQSALVTLHPASVAQPPSESVLAPRLHLPPAPQPPCAAPAGSQRRPPLVPTGRPLLSRTSLCHASPVARARPLCPSCSPSPPHLPPLLSSPPTKSL